MVILLACEAGVSVRVPVAVNGTPAIADRFGADCIGPSRVGHHDYMALTIWGALNDPVSGIGSSRWRPSFGTRPADWQRLAEINPFISIN